MNYSEWLQNQIQKSEITDIIMNGHNHFLIDCGRGLESIATPPGNEEEFKKWVIQTISTHNRSWDARYPFLDFAFQGEHRFHVVFPPITKKIVISIRCHHQRINSRWTDSEFFPFLFEQLSAGKTLVISGSTGSGKTTLIRELIDKLPKRERLIALEDTPEIQARHPQYLSLCSREPNADGFGEITLGQLIRQCLRMRPDRIILGECRGKEVFNLLQALNSGHTGSLTSIHANSNRDAIRRIELLCQIESKSPVSSLFIRDLIRSGIHFFVHLKRIRSPLQSDAGEMNGLELPLRNDRVISEISEVCGLEGETILLRQWAKEGKWIHTKKTDSIHSERTTLYASTNH